MKNLKQYRPDFEERYISGLEMDSRKVTAGNAFICIKGYTVDGHDYVKSAVKNGATVIFAEKELESFGAHLIVVPDTTLEMATLAKWFYEDPVSKLSMIGVTGTNGKTTTTQILCHLLGDDAAFIGTNGYFYHGVLKETKNTTPDSLTLYRIFDEFVRAGIKYVAMEVSSIALDLKRLYTVSFDVGIFTNLTHDHLDFHGTMENYLKSKATLFHMLKDEGFGIINLDDHYALDLIDEMDCPYRTYSKKIPSDYQMENSVLEPSYSSFELNGETYQYPLLGEFNQYNMLVAVSCALELGVTPMAIQDRLLSLPVIAGRMEVVYDEDFTVIVDYAHTPDGLEKILTFGSTVSKGRVISLVGCPGDRDKAKRPVMAKIACNLSDHAIFTTDDPHSEDPVTILEEMEQGVLGYGNYERIIDRKEAICKAISLAEPNDLIFIAGRGHQLYQYWSSGDIVLDDRVEAMNCIKKR